MNNYGGRFMWLRLELPDRFPQSTVNIFFYSSIIVLSATCVYLVS